MKLSFSLLKKHLETNCTFVQLINFLNSIGFEVENFKHEDSFKIVKITSVVKHENSDHLQICNVYDGEKTLQIVCGAKNPYVGMRTVLATIGSVMPNGDVIKESKIRGVVSFGMLCSEKELGLDVNVDGIIDLTEVSDNDIGSSFFDSVVELSVTPNRGYALSVIGIARDLAAAGVGKFINFINDFDFNPMLNIDLDLTIIDKNQCPFYSFRIIKNIKNKKSPYWLSRALENVGVRSINAVVDVLNYVTVLYGQPMHAYDFKKLNFPIKVMPGNNAKVVAINNKEYTVDKSITIISDEKEIYAIAGIIGGKNSECSLNTSEILLESAIFSHIDITKSGRKLNINSDARYRFERLVDPNFTLNALEIATKIILSICGGEISEIKCCGELPINNKIIKFDYEYFLSFTQLIISIKEITRILTNLGFEVQTKDLNYDDVSEKEMYIKVPSWLPNIDTIECIIGEVVRIYGYDKIPEIKLANTKTIVYHKNDEDIAREFLSMKGYIEVITWSFVDSTKVKNSKNLVLINPIAKNMDMMRPSIIPNLLDAYNKNFDKSINNIAIFEIGTVFQEDHDGKIIELNVISGLRAGKTHERNIYNDGHNIGFFDIKSDVISFIEHFRITNYTILAEKEICSQYLHPNRQASIYVNNKKIGIFGEVSPRISDKNIAIFEFSVSIFENKLTQFKESIVSIYQKVKRDFSFVFPNCIIAGSVIETIKNIEKYLIKDVKMFDLYVGDDNLEGKIIMGFEVTLQSADKTLTSEEIENVSNSIIDVMKTKFSGILRRDYAI